MFVFSVHAFITVYLEQYSGAPKFYANEQVKFFDYDYQSYSPSSSEQRSRFWIIWKKSGRKVLAWVGLSPHPGTVTTVFCPSMQSRRLLWISELKVRVQEGQTIDASFVSDTVVFWFKSSISSFGCMFTSTLLKTKHLCCNYWWFNNVCCAHRKMNECCTTDGLI